MSHVTPTDVATGPTRGTLIGDTDTVPGRERDCLLGKALQLTSVAALDGFLFGFDTAVINGATPGVSDRICLVDTPGLGARADAEDFNRAMSAALGLADLVLWVAK